jgi:hypothetical protein
MISLISPSKLLDSFIEGHLVIEGNAKQIFGGNDYTVDFSETAGFFFNCGGNCYKYDANQNKEKLPKSGIHGIYTEKFSYHFEQNIKLIFVILKPDIQLNNLQISAKNLVNSYATLTEAFGSTFRIIEGKVTSCSSLEERLNTIEEFLLEALTPMQKKSNNNELLHQLLQKTWPIHKLS